MSLMNAMKVSVVASSLALSASVSFAQEKIVGGEPVKSLEESPYMVSLSGSCGGSIISESWVLTAAHCVGHFSSVKGGILKLSESGSNFKIKQVIKHPKYDAWTNSNDFALVELSQKINFRRKKNLKPVLLATPEFDAEGSQAPGLDATVYGWGNIDEGQSNKKKELNKVVVPIVSNETANAAEAYAGAIDETMITAGYATGGKDSCQGDSGGPMVVFNAQNEPVQVGVVSWGEGCARANKYGVYAKVSTAYEWIKETIKARK